MSLAPPDPSGLCATLPNVFSARLICSDEECTEEFEARAATVAELETLACECGCALEVIGWADEDSADSGGVDGVELTPVSAPGDRVLA